MQIAYIEIFTKLCILFTTCRFPVVSQKDDTTSIMMDGTTVGVDGCNNSAYKTINQLNTTKYDVAFF